MSPKRSISALSMTLTKITDRASIIIIKNALKSEDAVNPWNIMKFGKAMVRKAVYFMILGEERRINNDLSVTMRNAEIYVCLCTRMDVWNRITTIAVRGNEAARGFFFLVIITTCCFEFEYQEEETKAEYSIRSGILDQENGTSDPSSCFPATKPSNIPVSTRIHSRRPVTADRRARSGASTPPQVCLPSPVSPVLCWVRVKGTILELGCLSSSPRSHSSLSKPLSGCLTLNKSLHFLTSATRVGIVPRVSVTYRAPFVSVPLCPGFHHQH